VVAAGLLVNKPHSNHTQNVMNDQWITVAHIDEGAMGAEATAIDISLWVWYHDGSNLRVRGRASLQYNLAGQLRITYYGEQLSFLTGARLGHTVDSSILLPKPTEWVLPKKAAKVMGEHTRGRVLVIGFTGIMVEKLQIAFRITDNADHGKFFIRTISHIQHAAE
jgi:hypothetical protein